MRDETREAMLQEIVNLAKQQALSEDEFTTEEFAEALGADQSEAYHTLKRLMRQGQVKMRSVVVDGHMHCAWKRIVSATDGDRIGVD